MFAEKWQAFSDSFSRRNVKKCNIIK